MRISSQWLRQWVDHGFADDELADRLTMAGLEVGRLIEAPRCDSKVVVGKVLSVNAHPERKNLSVCEVDVGRGDALKIVCGASNVRAGASTAVALSGATLGDGAPIRPAQVHGVLSQGMLCSEPELGLGDSADGIIIFDPDAPAGIAVNDYLQLNDVVLDIELTPNRADCISLAGVAREVSILSGRPVRAEPPKPVAAASEKCMPIEIAAPQLCPRYAGRVIESVDAGAKTPDWMKQRLHRAGLRCIHPLVDITNYVMIELGQPMHAFDIDLLGETSIVVRQSVAGETLTLLDGSQLQLREGSLLIADASRPIGLAGVMGGESSAITDSTVNVFLEAAYFAPNAIRFAVSNYGLHTDASHRFERGVDPNMQISGIERATELMVQIAGGTPGPVQNILNRQWMPEKEYCTVRESRIERVLGAQVPHGKIESILASVNEQCAPVDGGWRVKPWSYRFDLEAEHDQIEEIARIYGYDSIPTTLKFGNPETACSDEASLEESAVRYCLEQAGYFEAITYSFVDPELQDRICPSVEAQMLANPIASNMSAMRTSLWPGLIDSFCENYRRQQKQVKLYEIGRIFLPDQEVAMLGGLASGSHAPDIWSKEDRPIDFFDVKGDVENLLDLASIVDSTIAFRQEQSVALHPGCGAGIYCGNEKVGAIGQLHPDILRDRGILEPVFVFELAMRTLSKRSISKYKAVSRFPAIMRDLSFIIARQVAAERVSNIIRDVAGDTLESLKLFDLYSGAGIDSKKKSIGFRLIFRVKSRTLTDSEVDSTIFAIVKDLRDQIGAQLRE